MIRFLIWWTLLQSLVPSWMYSTRVCFDFILVVLEIRLAFLALTVHWVSEASLLVDPILLTDQARYSESVGFQHQCWWASYQSFLTSVPAAQTLSTTDDTSEERSVDLTIFSSLLFAGGFTFDAFTRQYYFFKPITSSRAWTVSNNPRPVSMLVRFPWVFSLGSESYN